LLARLPPLDLPSPSRFQTFFVAFGMKAAA
jgi:hypothetical protein